jgi:hypothetical protein
MHVPAHVGVHDGAPLSGMAPSGMALSGMTLSGMPLSGMTLSGMPLSGMPLLALPLRELEQPIETVPAASNAANRKKDTFTSITIAPWRRPRIDWRRGFSPLCRSIRSALQRDCTRRSRLTGLL